MTPALFKTKISFIKKKNIFVLKRQSVLKRQDRFNNSKSFLRYKKKTFGWPLNLEIIEQVLVFVKLFVLKVITKCFLVFRYMRQSVLRASHVTP